MNDIAQFKNKVLPAILTFAAIVALILTVRIFAAEEPTLVLTAANGTKTAESGTQFKVDLFLETADKAQDNQDDVLIYAASLEYNTNDMAFVTFDPAGSPFDVSPALALDTQPDDGVLNFEGFNTEGITDESVKIGTVTFTAKKNSGTSKISYGSDSIIGRVDNTTITPILGDITYSFGGGDANAPGAPQSLAANETTTNSTKLSWAASTDPEGSLVTYSVQRNGSTVAEGLNQTTYTDSMLTPNTTYQYTVTAKDQAGNTSGLSAVVSVKTTESSDKQAPTKPGNVQVASATESTMRLTWTESTDDSGTVSYRIAYASGQSVSNSHEGNSITVSGLSPNTSYDFTVIAVDEAGNVSEAATVTGRTQDVTATGKQPKFSIAAPASVNIGDQFSVTVYINPNDDAATADDDVLVYSVALDYDKTLVKYNSYAKNVSPFESPFVSKAADDGSIEMEGYTVDNVTADNTALGTLTFTALKAGKVDFKTASGGFIGMVNNTTQNVPVATKSSTIKAQATNPTPTDSQAPSAPGGMRTGNVTTSSVDLLWDASTDNTGVTGYNVYGRTAGGGSFTKVDETSATSLTKGGLSPGTSYEFYVRASDASQNLSDNSGIVSVTTASPPASAAPAPRASSGSGSKANPIPVKSTDSNPTPEPDPKTEADLIKQTEILSVGYRTLQIKVTATDIVKAYIEYGVSPSQLTSSTSKQELATNNILTISDAELIPGSTYYYRVVGETASSEVKYSTISKFTTKGIQVKFILRDGEGNLYTNKEVRLYSEVKLGRTDNKGEVTFNDVAPGVHTLVLGDATTGARQEVYVENTVAFSPNGVAGETMIPVVFELTFSKAATAAKTNVGVVIASIVGVLILGIAAFVIIRIRRNNSDISTNMYS